MNPKLAACVCVLLESQGWVAWHALREQRELCESEHAMYLISHPQPIATNQRQTCDLSFVGGPRNVYSRQRPQKPQAKTLGQLPSKLLFVSPCRREVLANPDCRGLHNDTRAAFYSQMMCQCYRASRIGFAGLREASRHTMYHTSAFADLLGVPHEVKIQAKPLCEATLRSHFVVGVCYVRSWQVCCVLMAVACQRLTFRVRRLRQDYRKIAGRRPEEHCAFQARFC